MYNSGKLQKDNLLIQLQLSEMRVNMNIIGIVTEFNPFHDGHQHLIDTIKKQLHPDGIVVIMSGDFVQRGAPAIFDKYTRTKKALVSGVDLVIELPVHYALCSAEEFAYGAVSILHSLGVVNTLAFGVETTEPYPSATPYFQMADFLLNEPASYQILLQQYIKAGFSYPVARKKALYDYSSKDSNLTPLLPLLETPNSILAIEYTKAISKLNSPITLYPVKRKGTISAHRIRDIGQQTKKQGIFINDFTIPFHWKLTNTTVKPDICDFSSELYHRLLQVYEPSKTLLQLIEDCKTKQYTYSRISRCFMRFVLDLDCNSDTYNWNFARILGFRKDNSKIIAKIKKTRNIPIIQKINSDTDHLSFEYSNAIRVNNLCHNRYASIAAQKYKGTWQLKTEEENGIIMV